MGFSSRALGTLQKLGKGASRLAVLTIADGLMDENTAKALSALQGDKKNLKFHSEEIDILQKSFKSSIPSIFNDLFKFGELTSKDNDTRLVASISLKKPDMLPLIVSYYDLEQSNVKKPFVNDFIYVMIRKVSASGQSVSSKAPPILKLLDKSFHIEISIVAATTSRGDYTNYKNIITLGNSVTNSLKFVCFFDLSKNVNSILKGMNTIIQNENLNPLDNKSYINLNTARTLMIGTLYSVKSVIEQVLTTAPRSAIIRNNDFGLRQVFKSAVNQNRVADIKPVVELESQIITALRNKLTNGISSEAFGKPIIKISTTGTILSFEFNVRGSNIGLLIPRTEIEIDIKSAKASLEFQTINRGLLSAQKTKFINNIREIESLKSILLASGPVVESKAIKDFIDIIFNVLEFGGTSVKNNLITIL